MGPRQGFGLHIDFANSVMARSVDLSPSELNDSQAKRPVPQKIARGVMELTQLSPGVGYGSWICDDVRDETTMATELPSQHLAFPFHLLADPIEVGIAGITQPILLARTEFYILGPSVVGTQTIRPGVPLHQTCLYVNATTIDSCFADRQLALPADLKLAFTHPGREPFFARGSVTTSMSLALHQVLSSSLCGGVARLYLEAKALEIVALRLDQLGDTQPAHRRLRLMRSDLDRLEEARHILLSRYDEPPTITELSQAVGLNRTKLKAGFKFRFGTTVFGFIRTQRMQRAHMLLRDGDCNVSEAAAAVGYNSLSAFTAAFKAEFGFPPQTIRGCSDIAGLE